MTRPVIILLLLLSTATMMRGVASDWRKGLPVPAEGQAKKASVPTPAAAPPSQDKASFQPVVPGELPDLKEGYLFNQERMLAGAEPPPPEEGDIDQEIKPPGIAASIDEVTYTGSVITETFSFALIVYPPPAKTKAAAPAPPSSKSSKSSRFKGKMPAAASSSAARGGGGEEHGRLEVGDVLDGYEVAEILPNKLIFTKGEETVEKLLHDPSKKRVAPPSPPPGAMPGGARPQQAGQAPGAPPSPAGSRSTTIGGSAQPAPATAASPAGPGQATSPVPAPPPAIPSSPRSTAPAAATKGMQPSPVRRMVISRQPAVGPNTSRVLRQAPEASDMGQPPGMIPGGSVPPLPTPEGE